MNKKYLEKIIKEAVEQEVREGNYEKYVTGPIPDTAKLSGVDSSKWSVDPEGLYNDLVSAVVRMKKSESNPKGYEFKLSGEQIQILLKKVATILLSGTNRGVGIGRRRNRDRLEEAIRRSVKQHFKVK